MKLIPSHSRTKTAGDGARSTNLRPGFTWAESFIPMENSPATRADEIGEETSAIRPARKIRRNKQTFGTRRRGRYKSEEAIEQQSSWRRPPCYSMVKCLIPSLLGVFAVKYQAMSEDPFKTHSLHTWSFIAAIFIYSLVLGAMKHLQCHRYKYLETLITSVSLASVVLSTLSLVSLLLPHFPGLLLLCISWTLSAVIAAWPIFQCTCKWLLTGIRTVFHMLISFARNLCTGWNFTQKRPPMPPVTGRLPI